MAQKIEDALLQHDTSPCLAWCAENKSKLKKIRVRSANSVHQIVAIVMVVVVCFWQSCLEFRVRVQDFIEMIKADKRMEAIRLVGLLLGFSVGIPLGSSVPTTSSCHGYLTVHVHWTLSH